MIANTNTMNNNTAPMDIQTILFILEDLFDFTEFDSFVAEGPSACFPWSAWFPGLLPEVGGVCSELGPKKNGGTGGGVPVAAGGGNGAILVLNGFPACLYVTN